jgi:hypothetical protein
MSTTEATGTVLVVVRESTGRYTSEERGGKLAALLDAQESIPHYLDFVFTVHGRVRPYNKWLEWELRKHPLPLEIDLERLERIARTGALEDQQTLFRETEALARAHGHGARIDGWEPDVLWLRGSAAASPRP